MTVTLTEDLWLVERPDGFILMSPIIGHTPSFKRIECKAFAGGQVRVLRAGDVIEVNA